jgi:uncharacterized protein YkwD
MSRGLVKTARVLGLTLAISVVFAALAPSAQAGWAPRRDMLRWMNAARQNHGAVALDRVWVLRHMADEHSMDMAREGRIYHTSDLGHELRRVSWHVAGENVGVGTRLRPLFEAFMDSAPHRANILGQSFRRVGIGLHRADGFLWITLIFVG